MNSLVASDLDRTLIYSAGAAGIDVAALECVELYQGGPLSYLTPRAAGLLAELAARAVFVPVTTRTREQYHRITLPAGEPAYAICANGGHLLVDGVTDQDWHDGVRKRLSESAIPLGEVVDRVTGTAAAEWTLKRRTAEELFCYLVVDRAAMPLSYVEELSGWCGERGWSVSLQGRKLYAVPHPLTKSAAVAEVARRAGTGTLLAAGDSLLDADLLEAADAAVRPGHGELADAGWSAPGVHALTERGVAAGEAILDWFLART
ncbi:MAG: hypothetical protein ACRDT6_27450 [Micromonosporaceae bacterium]